MEKSLWLIHKKTQIARKIAADLNVKGFRVIALAYKRNAKASDEPIIRLKMNRI